MAPPLRNFSSKCGKCPLGWERGVIFAILWALEVDSFTQVVKLGHPLFGPFLTQRRKFGSTVPNLCPQGHSQNQGKVEDFSNVIGGIWVADPGCFFFLPLFELVLDILLKPVYFGKGPFWPLWYYGSEKPRKAQGEPTKTPQMGFQGIFGPFDGHFYPFYIDF